MTDSVKPMTECFELWRDGFPSAEGLFDENSPLRQRIDKRMKSDVISVVLPDFKQEEIKSDGMA